LVVLPSRSLLLWQVQQQQQVLSCKQRGAAVC
jgi:hypothetical protein